MICNRYAKVLLAILVGVALLQLKVYVLHFFAHNYETARLSSNQVQGSKALAQLVEVNPEWGIFVPSCI